MKLGVCYYPEHWPADRWPIDAAMMRDAGLTVRAHRGIRLAVDGAGGGTVRLGLAG